MPHEEFNTDHYFFFLKYRNHGVSTSLLFRIKKQGMLREKCSHQVLQYAITKLKAAGYRLVTVSECTGLPPYQSVQAPGVRDVSYQMTFM